MRTLEQKTAVVLLAAGRGERFGGDKLKTDFRGRPLWEWGAKTAEELDFTERVVVVAPKNSFGKRRGWRQVENPHAAQGMGSSIAAGVRTVSTCDRIVITLADMPFVTAAHLSRLSNSDGVAFTRYEDDLPGCPAAFPRSTFAGLKGLSGEQGARSLGFPNAHLIAPSDRQELADIDTRGDLKNLISEK